MNPFGIPDELVLQIKSYALACAMDADSCKFCKVQDGKEWERLEDINWVPGLDCRSPEGCRCQIMPIFKDEGTVMLD